MGGEYWLNWYCESLERDDYRCECNDEACISYICGVREMPMRRNYMWYNFWLALILWGCLCGCCGTKIVFKKRSYESKCLKCFRCRKCRMVFFYLLFGLIALFHGGIPAFMFFMLISACSLCCAYKCEN